MKKIKIAPILTAVVLIGGVVSAPLINKYCAYKVEKALCETPLPERTELVESLSWAGKLTRNGMQYLGVMLIQSELSLEELETYYSDYRNREREYLVEVQKGQSVGVIEHGTPQFSEKIEGSDYYIVYSWGDGTVPFNELDIRGH